MFTILKESSVGLASCCVCLKDVEESTRVAILNASCRQDYLSPLNEKVMDEYSLDFTCHTQQDTRRVGI